MKFFFKFCVLVNKYSLFLKILSSKNKVYKILKDIVTFLDFFLGVEYFVGFVWPE